MITGSGSGREEGVENGDKGEVKIVLESQLGPRHALYSIKPKCTARDPFFSPLPPFLEGTRPFLPPLSPLTLCPFLPLSPALPLVRVAAVVVVVVVVVYSPRGGASRPFVEVYFA